MAKKNNLDKLYVDTMREGSVALMQEYFKLALKKSSYKEIEASVQCRRHLYEETITENEILIGMPKELYTELENYALDICLMTDNLTPSIKPLVTKIKNNLIEKLQNSNYKIDLYIYINTITIRLDVARRVTTDSPEYIFSCALLQLAFYVSSYLVKLKNKRINKFEKTEQGVKIIYGTKNAFSEQQLLKKSLAIAEENITMFDVASSNYSVADVANEYLKYSLVNATLQENGRLSKLPFWDNNTLAIDESLLKRIPHNRLYAVPSSGIRFEFLDKTENIDFIEFKEVENKFVFYARFINTSKSLKLVGESQNDNIIHIPFIIDKWRLDESWSINNIARYCKIISFAVAHIDSLNKIISCCLCCAYIALYDPSMFTDKVKMHKIDRNSASGYSKDEAFRIAHLRKLPLGSNISPQAKELAKQNGFDYIPTGYTFVRASNIQLQSKEKKLVELDLKNIDLKK